MIVLWWISVQVAVHHGTTGPSISQEPDDLQWSKSWLSSSLAAVYAQDRKSADDCITVAVWRVFSSNLDVQFQSIKA